MPSQSKQPVYMRRCVAKVSKDKDLSSAFAICTKVMQDAGYLKPNSRVQTKAGKKRARQYAARKDFKSTEASYQKALEKARTEQFSKNFTDYILENIK